MGKARELTPWWVTIGARCLEAVRIVNRLHSLGVHVLFDAAKAARKEELKALYKQRWAVELDIRHIKETMGIGAQVDMPADDREETAEVVEDFTDVAPPA